MSKQFLGVILIIIAVFVGIFMFGNQKTEAPSGKSSDLTQHVIGEGKSGVTLVEYGDYQCPFCHDYFPTVKAAQTEFNSQIKFQFRNYPLSSRHPNAFAAARAAEAAALQDKFWEMHDALYDTANWQTWTNSSNPNPLFEQYAKKLGLDVAKYKTDFASSKVNNLVNADLAEGTRQKVSGTPSFFILIDGKKPQKVEITNDLAAFEKVIKAAIAKNPQPANAGTTSQTPGTVPGNNAQ